MEIIAIIFIAYIAYQIYDHTNYPNKFRGTCGNCKKKHGRNQWHPTRLGKKYPRSRKKY